MDTTLLLKELNGERDRIDRCIAVIEKELGGGGSTTRGIGRNTKPHYINQPRATSTLRSTAGKRGPMSPAARKRLSLSMKQRWASGKMGRRRVAA